MMHIQPLRIETRTSPPIRVKDTRLYFRARVVELRLPVPHGGLIWNQPVSVVVRAPGGQEQVLSVPDLTRTVMIGLLVLNLAGAFLFMLFRRKNASS
jgi:hypothetical protein